MLKILIVEDSPLLACRIIETARALGFEVVWADCERKANESLLENNFTVVSIDGSFPDMFSLNGTPSKIGAKMAREMAEDGDSHIVFYSADPDQVRAFEGNTKVTALLKEYTAGGVSPEVWASKCLDLCS